MPPIHGALPLMSKDVSAPVLDKVFASLTKITIFFVNFVDFNVAVGSSIPIGQ
jgi:hypothetical protein